MAALWRVIRRILKWGGIAVLGLVGLVLVLFTIAWVINAHDEPLSSQAKSLLIPPPNPYPPEDNIYLALAGFDAPPGGSVTATGQAKVEEYNKYLDARLHQPGLESLLPVFKVRPGSLQFSGNVDFAPQPVKSYWNQIPAHRAEVEKLMADNRELFRRYGDLRRRRGYFETAMPGPVGPVVGPGIGMRTLFLADAVLRLRSDDAGQQSQALRDLTQDVQLWRAVLTGEGALIGKLLAVGCIHADELVLADVIADPGAPVPVDPDDADRVTPLFATQDWDIGKVFASEFRIQYWEMQQTSNYIAQRGAGSVDCDAVHRWLCRVNAWVSAHFFKINATENLFAETAAQLAPRADLAQPRSEPDNDYQRLVAPRLVYNPLGKVLVAVSATYREDYPRRAWDGAAFQRLVRLGYEIRRQHVDLAGIPAFLKQHPEWSTHPGDRRPFLWDPAKEQISVQTMAKHPGNRAFFVHVWKAPSGA